MNKKARELKAKEAGRRGGLIGGPRRADVLGPARCREIATQAAKARWHPESPVVEA